MIEQMRRKDRFAQLAGLEIVSAESGRAVVEMVIRDCHLNAMDSVHGGAIFTLADYAFALASNAAAHPSVGLSVSIQYLRPGKSGKLTAKAHLLSTTGRMGTYLVEVVDDAGEVVASFQGLAYTKAGKSGGGAGQ